MSRKEKRSTRKFSSKSKIFGAVFNRVTCALLLLAVCSFALVAMAKSNYTVAVASDGTTKTVKTSAKDASDVLEDAGITLGKKDRIDTSDYEAGANVGDGNKITVYRAKTVSVYEDGKKAADIIVAGTVSDALNLAKVDPIRADDVINYSKNTPLKSGMKIRISRAFTVTVEADGAKKQVVFRTGTVQDALDRAGVTLGKNDTVSPSADTVINKGRTITIHRVKYKTRVENETIAYNTITRTSSSLPVGQTSIQQSGSNGSKIVTYEDKYVDGKLAETNTINSTVTREAVDQIVLKGASASNTGIRFNASTSIDSPLAVIHGSSTAYTASAGARTASGALAQKGYVAVNPNQIPYGSKLYIKADDGTVYGYAIAADTGGFATDGSAVVDLYMNSYNECCAWGRKNVTISVLEWGNGTV